MRHIFLDPFKTRWLQPWVLSYWIICHRKSGIANIFLLFLMKQLTYQINWKSFSGDQISRLDQNSQGRVCGILLLWGCNNRSSYQRFDNWCCSWVRTIYGWLSWPVLWWCGQYVWALEWSFITFKGWTWHGYLRSLYDNYMILLNSKINLAFKRLRHRNDFLVQNYAFLRRRC